MMGTDPLATEDKSNQNHVLQIESANDPIVPEFNDQSVNTIVNVQEEVKSEIKIPTEKIDEILARIVKTQMEELTPLLIEECKKFIQNHLTDASKEHPINDIATHT
jgi:hypothetical protein